MGRKWYLQVMRRTFLVGRFLGRRWPFPSCLHNFVHFVTGTISEIGSSLPFSRWPSSETSVRAYQRFVFWFSWEAFTEWHWENDEAFRDGFQWLTAIFLFLLVSLHCVECIQVKKGLFETSMGYYNRFLLIARLILILEGTHEVKDCRPWNFRGIAYFYEFLRCFTVKLKAFKLCSGKQALCRGLKG